MHPGGDAQGALPLDPARGIMPLDPKLLYDIAPSVAASPATLGAFLYKAWAGVPEYDAHLFEVSLSTMFLFRRRSNEQLERDVLRHDVVLFGVEPPTNAHSFGDVFESDEYFFEDGLTRRSAKRSQAVQPPLERRGALSECRATPLI